MKKCYCGSADCWLDGDYSWLQEGAKWQGMVGGARAYVYFIHGKQIAEERHLPEGSWPVEEFIERLRIASAGMSEPVLAWSSDTGGGDAGLWLRGVRDPLPEDWKRLEEVRARQLRSDREELERLHVRIALSSLL